MMNSRKRILVVDDEPTNLKVLKQILEDQYQLIFAKSGGQAIEQATNQLPDLILMDVMMPQMTGIEACQHLKQLDKTRHIPVIFVTALKEESDEAAGFAAGGVDYISKPVRAAVVRARVSTHLSLVQAEELRRSRLEVIQRLGRASEYKDNETGTHILRMSHYSHLLAKACGFTDEQAEMLLNAAPMHDIGKIGIPDRIMLKPSRLTVEEFSEMQKHPQIGADILGESDSELINLAKSVSLYHHEKWDGSGYPHGLKGTDIPIEARIVAIADVFDALTSKRPYKEAWPVEKALEFLHQQRGRHFDPDLVSHFSNMIDKVLEIKARWPEEEED